MDLNQITLPVKNMKTATDFYLKMGFLQIVEADHYARFECPSGNSTFSLLLQTTNFTSGAHIYFEEEYLDNLVDKLIAKGFKFDQMPTDMDYLWREAILHDPSGNTIILYWAGKNRLNPPWRIEKRL